MKIKSIKSIGKKEVYDLTVKKNHNYIVSGCVFHNCDYTGPIKVILTNLSKEEYTINVYDRIAQLVVAPYVRVSVLEVDSLDKTERGSGGLGSTGR